MPGNKMTLSPKNLELPPLQEWLEFQAEQLKSAAEFFCSDIKNIVTEVVQKNKGELSKEDYKSYKISSLAMRQFRQSIEKTIANLTEMVSQADVELSLRFEKNEEDTGSGADESESREVGEAESRTSDDGQKEDDEERSVEDGGADSDGSCTTVDESSPEKNPKGGSRDESFFEDDHLSMEEDEEEEGMGTAVLGVGNEESSINEINATVETVNGDDLEEGENAAEKAKEDDKSTKSSSSRRAVRSPSPAETVFMTPPSKSASKSVPIVRPPSPAETVALFSPSKKSKEPEVEKRILRRPRSPSPAGTVLINRKKTDDSDDEDATARRSVLSSFPKTPDEKPKTRSSKRSPSPADTVMLGRRNNQASDSDDEDSNARKSVLSSNSKDRKSSRRSPSPADTVMLSRSKNALSDSDDEDAKARRSVLSSDSKSSVNAPFKKPRVMSKASSEDEQVPSKSSAAAAEESEQMEVDQVPAKWQDDPKLKPHASQVQVERLEKVILDKLDTQGFVYVYPKNKKSKKKDDDEAILDRAIKRLVNLNPIVSTSSRRRGRPKKSRPNSEKKKSKKSGSDSDEGARARDDSADEVSDDDAEPVLTRAVRPLTKSVSKDGDEESHGSDDEELESKKESVSDDEDRYARDKILKGARKIATVSSSDEKDEKDEKTSKSNDKKEKRKSYYTPQVHVKSKDSSDEDSDDDFVAPKKKPKTRGRGTIRSDSEESRSSKEQNNKSEKRYSTEELSSDSDSQQPVAKNKRRRLSSRDEDKKSKPKRRRVKTLSDSDSDDSDAPKKKSKKKKKDPEEVVIDSDSDEEVTKDDTEAKGRKKIRGIISKSDLQKETRKAEKEEEERKKRISERQSQFNGIFKPPEGEAMAELVLDFDPVTKKPLLVVDPEITRKLKRHQADGIRFMWQSCFESVEQFKKPSPGSGCILAHCMGLGKTLQTVAFLHTVMTSEVIGLKTALVICPLNTVTNWSNEVKMWTRNADKQVYVHALYDGKNLEQKVSDLKYWMKKGGVGIIHYDSFRALVGGKQKKKLKDTILECLVDPGADIVVCDEGHVFKNDKSKMAQAVHKIRTLRRVVLTGTPLQNNLTEYHCMMQFVKPNLLGSKKEFLNRFVNPITNGQHKDSTASDVKLMKKRAHVLHKLLDGCVQRLDYSVLVPYLPPKYEYVISIRMTDIQNKLYCHYLESIKSVNDMQVLVKQLLKHSANLAKVYSHPKALELKHAQKMDNGDDELSSEAGSLKDFIDDDTTEESSMESGDTSDNDDSDIDWLDDDGFNKIEKKKRKKDKKKELDAVKSEKGEMEEKEEEEEGKEDVNELSGSIIESGGNWWFKFFKSKDEMGLMEHSSKMIVLFEILKTCESIQDKVLVFSQNLYSLDLIEEFLGALDDEGRKGDNKRKTFPPTDNPNVSRWRRNIEYFRIDGSTKHHDRQKNCDTFNKKTDTSKAKLFLISTKAGGIGINLIGANRVVIFDASWNPSQDMQSIFRVFRFGQTKPCYVYRLLAKGTIEEKIYNRQVVKLALSGRVIDEHQIERHFTFDHIAKMFVYNPDEETDCPTPDVPKDRLLADLLMSHKDIIYTYHEHDSLLQNQVDQGLTEDERKVAWEEYQNEKEHRVTMPNPDHNDIQQAYEKMRAKIRLMYPNVTDAILSMYVRKIQHEMLELRKETAWFLESRSRMEIQAAVSYQNRLSLRKEQISKFFSVPGFLANAMKSEIDKYVQRSVNNPLFHAQRNGLISIARNILEGQSRPGPSHMHQSNMTNLPHLLSNMMIQQQQQQQQQPHQPAVLQQRPSIPTIPVPYHPSRDEDVVNLD